MRHLLASLGIVAILSFTAVPVLVSTPVQAATTQEELCRGANIGNPNACTGSPATADTQLKDRISTITNTILYITGAIAVIVLIFGGFRYVTSTGDASRIKQAKDTIVYAITGIVVALLAFAIVNFVISRIGG